MTSGGPLLVSGDTYLQPTAPDPVLSEDRVISLVRRHALATAVRSVDETGGEARAYMVDDTIVLKVQRPHRMRPRTSLEKEAYFLNLLAAHSVDNVPRVLGYGRDGDVEYICLSRMPGVAARNLDLAGEDRKRVLSALGQTLWRIHSLPLGAFDERGLFPGDRDRLAVQSRVEKSVRQAALAIAGQRDVWDIGIAPEVLAEEVIASIDVGDMRAALHSNPGPEHVFVDPARLAFCGLIDFGDAYVSHPAFDLRRWIEPADRSALMEGYAADGVVSPSFMKTWRAVLIGALLGTVAQWPERRQKALHDMRRLLAES